MTLPDAPDAPGLLVYAVVRAERDLPDDATGVDGSALSLVPYGEIGAVVSEVAPGRPIGRRADLTAYSDVVAALVPGGVVVPIGFGTVLPDDHEVVAELLAPREAELAELLTGLDGQVQYNLRAGYVDETVLAEIVRGDPEIGRLRERTRGLPEDVAIGDRIRLGELVAQAWERLAYRDADRLLREVAPVLTAHAVRREPAPSAALDAALLVEAARAQELEDTLEHLAEQTGGRMRLRLVGPLAPYDFVGTP